MQVKMCLTGEGSDELFGGYVYFSDAPDKQQFQGELNRIYSALGNVNLKRADRMTMAHGLEARVPFLDVKFTAKAMSLDPKHKMIGAFQPELNVKEPVVEMSTAPLLNPLLLDW